MLEDFRLKVFMAVAEEGSFTKAASVLSITQPAVSQNISELERTTGVRLFDRLRGEVRLTEQGRVFRTHVSRILEAYKSTSNLFSSVSETIVRVKASDELYEYVSRALDLFGNIHPEVKFVRSDDEDSELTFRFVKAPTIMGGIPATHNIISTMFLMCKPSEDFTQTELFDMLRGFMSDIIS